jgi:hypothetical protein
MAGIVVLVVSPFPPFHDHFLDQPFVWRGVRWSNLSEVMTLRIWRGVVKAKRGDDPSYIEGVVKAKRGGAIQGLKIKRVTSNITIAEYILRNAYSAFH